MKLLPATQSEKRIGRLVVLFLWKIVYTPQLLQRRSLIGFSVAVFRLCPDFKHLRCFVQYEADTPNSLWGRDQSNKSGKLPSSQQSYARIRPVQRRLTGESAPAVTA